MTEELTKNQIEAASHFTGPAIVIAGPGSGKTRVITERVAFLIKDKKVEPSSILVTTFTEKAADELKHRLFGQVGKHAEHVHISTVHSFCKSLMEEFFYCHDFGIDFTVLDGDSQKLLVLANRSRLDLGGRRGWRDLIIRSAGYQADYEGEVGRLYNFITENLIDTKDVKSGLAASGELSHDMEKLLDSYDIYVDILKNENSVDFAHLEKTVYCMLKNNREILSQIRGKIKFILVDEYQDTNPVQDFIFRGIAGDDENIFVVGDKNQSIYGFRGAAIENFTRFSSEYKGAKEYFLNTNFRSTDKIVDAANKIFENRIREKLVSFRGRGNSIVIIRGETRKTAFLNSVKYLKSKNIQLNDIAFLYRKKVLAEDIIWALMQESVPFQTDSDGKFLDRAEVKSFVSLFGYVYQDEINESDFSGWKDWWRPDLFDNEVLKVSAGTYDVLTKLPKETNLADHGKPDDLLQLGISDKSDTGMIADILKLRKDVNDKKKGLLDVLFELFRISKYLSRLMNDPSDENEESLYNLAKLTRLLDNYERMFKRPTAKGFLYILYNSGRAKNMDQIILENSQAVRCMTVHKSKGLEFPAVVLCSMAEKDFPLEYRNNKEICGIPFDKKFVRAGNLHIDESKHYAEELRLFYVAITRAQDLLVLTVPEKANKNKLNPSRFLQLIDGFVTEDIKTNITLESHYKQSKQTPVLSYTSVSTYMDCPFRYKLNYIYRFNSPSGVMQRQGIIIHNVLQRINVALKNGEKIDRDIIGGFTAKFWLPITGKKSDESLKNEIIDFAFNYYIFAKKSYKSIVSVEEPFTYIDDDLIIKGKTDLIARDIDDNNVLVDFKARTSEGIEEISVDKQLNIYNYCLNNLALDKLMAYTVLDNKMHEIPVEKEHAKNMLQSVSAKLKNENFELNSESPLCKTGNCVYSFICKELKDGKK